MSKNVQFVVDGEDHKTAVIVPIQDYEEMMEDLHMGKLLAKAKTSLAGH